MPSCSQCNDASPLEASQTSTTTGYYLAPSLKWQEIDRHRPPTSHNGSPQHVCPTYCTCRRIEPSAQSVVVIMHMSSVSSGCFVSDSDIQPRLCASRTDGLSASVRPANTTGDGIQEAGVEWASLNRVILKRTMWLAARRMAVSALGRWLRPNYQPHQVTAPLDTRDLHGNNAYGMHIDVNSRLSSVISVKCEDWCTTGRHASLVLSFIMSRLCIVAVVSLQSLRSSLSLTQSF